MKSPRLKHLLAIFFICGVASLHYWNVNPASYPWWHELNNDIDAAHATTTVGLLNNSEFTFIYHPAATISSLHGAVYRLLATVDLSHQKLLHLNQVERFEDAFVLIAIATKTSRYIIWITYLMFILVVYGVLWRLTQSVRLAFFFTFYISCFKFSLIHSAFIRPEILSLIFALFGAYVFLTYARRETVSWHHSLTWYTVISFLFGFAIFSKIQIIPVILILLLLMTAYLYWKRGPLVIDQRWIILVLLANAVLFPWWSFFRPEFMTAEFLNNLNPHSDLSLVYGPAPKTMVALPLIIFFLIAIIAGFLLKARRTWHTKLVMLFVWLNGLFLGFGLSIYAVLSPVCASWHQYLKSTQHMVYATMTNSVFVFHGYLSQPAVKQEGFSIFSLEALQRIFSRLNEANLLYVHLGYILIAVTLLCWWQIFKDPQRRTIYGLVLVCFLTAFVMDVLSLQRDPLYKHIYFIYTITFYGIGLAIAARSMKSKAAIIAISAIMLLHILSTVPSWNLHQQEQAVSQQDPMIEWEYLAAYTQPFWNIVHEALRQHL